MSDDVPLPRLFVKDVTSQIRFKHLAWLFFSRPLTMPIKKDWKLTESQLKVSARLRRDEWLLRQPTHLQRPIHNQHACCRWALLQQKNDTHHFPRSISLPTQTPRHRAEGRVPRFGYTVLVPDVKIDQYWAVPKDSALGVPSFDNQEVSSYCN